MGDERASESEVVQEPKAIIWFDLISPQGVRFHIVGREGLTYDGLRELMRILTTAANKAIESGWYGELSPSRGQGRSGGPPKLRRRRKVQERSASDGRVEMTVEQISRQLTSTGKTVFKIYGVSAEGDVWTQYGVNAWPETVLDVLQPFFEEDLMDLKPGLKYDISDLGLVAVVQLSEEGKPRKVVDWREE